MDYAAKVARAASYLDVIKPGWADLVNLETFNMSVGSQCVCGQAGLEWSNVMGELNELTGDDFGEVLASNDIENRVKWVEEIEKRKTPLPPAITFSGLETVYLNSESELALNGDELVITDREGDSATINLHSLRMTSVQS